MTQFAQVQNDRSGGSSGNGTRGSSRNGARGFNGRGERGNGGVLHCYNCGSTEHLVADCPDRHPSSFNNSGENNAGGSTNSDPVSSCSFDMCNLSQRTSISIDSTSPIHIIMNGGLLGNIDHYSKHGGDAPLRIVPAISFGTTGGNRVEMIVKDPIKVAKVPKKKSDAPIPKEKQQIRNKDNVVIETDLERRWRVSREETCELLSAMMGKGDDKLSPARKRIASEITNNVKKSMKDVIIGANNAKKRVLVSLETAKSTTILNREKKSQYAEGEPSSTQVSAYQDSSSLISDKVLERARIQARSDDDGDNDDNFKCLETIEIVEHGSHASSRDLEILAAQKVAILQQLAVTVKSAALKMTEDRIRRRGSNQQIHPQL
eukprot:CAMPEP_0116018560 /NCGR_PEP_ID=MMETSP0321-20121206/8715_1 /TAXON_ID=163516 /ORGANISM="Leptocylindrus danicus var. danicus, Strain B650" /LENGTH=375 /DNA_ID=CAMNT_0003488965 /DNA_START=711 /DNA_END=1838 /DNA_ORIENTATION=+